jgi:hypothetical protein
MVLFRRHNYDRPWHCPGWEGGGYRWPKFDAKPPYWEDELLGPFNDFHRKRRHWWQPRSTCRYDGRLWAWGIDDPWQQWRWHRCNRCNIVAVPFITRWIDPFFWVAVIQHLAWTVRREGWRQQLWYNIRTWPRWRWDDTKLWFTLLYEWYSPKHMKRLEMDRRRVRAAQGLED